MNWEEIKQKISEKKVGIAGCGGLGSNAAVALARVGIKHFVIVDFDVIEASNLNRQYFFKRQIGKKKVFELKNILLAIDETIDIEAIDLELKPNSLLEVFKNCDLLIEAFDKAETKQMMAETVMQHWPDKPLIMGNGMAGIGGFEKIQQQQWSNNVYVCGDFESEISENLPPLAPRVAIVANMQANLALEILLR